MLLYSIDHNYLLPTALTPLNHFKKIAFYDIFCPHTTIYPADNEPQVVQFRTIQLLATRAQQLRIYPLRHSGLIFPIKSRLHSLIAEAPVIQHSRITSALTSVLHSPLLYTVIIFVAQRVARKSSRRSFA